jgi:hypothetical protein
MGAIRSQGLYVHRCFEDLWRVSCQPDDLDFVSIAVRAATRGRGKGCQYAQSQKEGDNHGREHTGRQGYDGGHSLSTVRVIPFNEKTSSFASLTIVANNRDPDAHYSLNCDSLIVLQVSTHSYHPSARFSAATGPMPRRSSRYQWQYRWQEHETSNEGREPDRRSRSGSALPRCRRETF